MKALSTFDTTAEAVQYANKMVHDGWVVVVTAEPEGPGYRTGASTLYTVWGTKKRTVMTGGWNR